MFTDSSGIFSKRVSSVASLVFIGFLAFILGTYVIIESRKIEKLQEPFISQKVWMTQQDNLP